MAARHVVVDGSNLATEGRSMPSLAQLDQAVREFLTENPEDVVTVVVDASFGHRIDSSESKMFEEAEDAGELVSPPAGAIGRGDAFLLRIADKTGATVLSNDSFQEFHGDYDWLFERGRLIGGKPVPGVGWIFTPRTPVRGPRSREAVKEAKRKSTKEPESAKPGLDLAAERSRAKGQGKGKKNVERAIAVALEEAVAPKDKPHRRRKGGSPPADPVNDPLTFITFIAAHPLGAEVTATVESFASHGAFVDSKGARCYVPLSAMGNPPPKSAREIFTKGQEVTFVVQALDPQRRGVELAVPGFAKIAGAPTDETVAAEIEGRADDEAEGLGAAAATAATVAPPPVRRTRKKAPPAAASEAGPAGPAGGATGESVDQPAAAPVKKAASRRRGARLSPDGSAELDSAAITGEPPAVPAEAATGVASLQAAPQQSPVAGARPSRRRGSPSASAVPVEAEKTDESAAADAPVAPAGARRRRGSSQPPEGSGGPVVVSEATAPASPIRPPRRRSRAVATEQAAGGEQSSDDAGSPAAPVSAPASAGSARPARRARRGGASPEPPSDAALDHPVEPAPAASRRRRTGGAATADAGPAVPAEPAPAGGGSRRRGAPAAPGQEMGSSERDAPAAASSRRAPAGRVAPPAAAPQSTADPAGAGAGAGVRRRRPSATTAEEPAATAESAPQAPRARRTRSPQETPAATPPADVAANPSPRRRRRVPDSD